MFDSGGPDYGLDAGLSNKRLYGRRVLAYARWICSPQKSCLLIKHLCVSCFFGVSRPGQVQKSTLCPSNVRVEWHAEGNPLLRCAPHLSVLRDDEMIGSRGAASARGLHHAFTFHLSPFTFHLSPFTFHLSLRSPLTSHETLP